MKDLRYALRQLRKSPGFTFIAVLTLALGIGANTAIFSAIYAVLLRPLPFKEPSRLVAIWETNEQPGAERNLRNEVAKGNFHDWRKQNQVFEQIAALTYGSFNLVGGEQPERVQGAAVSFNYFDTLGVAPARGRSFLASEEKEGASRVAVISHGLWQRRFGGDPNLVGQTQMISGEPFVIVGIMPAGFRVQFPVSTAVDLWTPLRAGPNDGDRVAHFMYVFGRLKNGVSLKQAQAGMNVLSQQMRQQYPETNKSCGINLIPLHQQLVGKIQPYLYVLFAAVGFVLLIAGANVANLMLARLAGREKEMSLRLALGASRGRLIRQLLTESLMLSMLGGSLGLVFAAWGAQFLRALAPAELPRLSEIALNGSVFVWTLGLLVIMGIAVGLAPAWQASRSDLNRSLQESGRGSGGLRRSRIGRAIVISEIALALFLLVGAGLMIRSARQLQRVDPGFEAKNLLTLNISLPRQKYKESGQANVFFDQLLAGIERLPTVESVGGVDPLPMSGSDSSTGILIGGQPIVPESDRAESGERVVTPNYFSAMGIPLLEGRQLSEQDRADTPDVIVVNEALARKFFPSRTAVGKRLGLQNEEKLRWAEIVGVVGNMKHRTLDAEIKPELFEPYHQWPRNFLSVVVRTKVEPSSVIGAVRGEVLALDKDQPVFEIMTMNERLAQTLAQSRFIMLLLEVFSGLALTLAAIGIYGVMAYFVSQRNKEIGIRLALGAQKLDVLKLVVLEGMVLGAVGVAIGLAASLGLTRIIASLLFGVRPTDALTLVGVSALLSSVTLLACLIPARRAARVDPMIALRAE